MGDKGKWKPSRQASRICKALRKEWEPITFEKIAYRFKQTELVLNFSDRVLYLPPLKKDPNFVPVLSLYCKLDETHNIAKLRVMLVHLEDCFDEQPKGYGIGFRMETPESMNQNTNATTNEGIHDFHHAQLIRKFGQSNLDKLPIDCPSWLPQSQPSFPMPAKCPVTLLLCLIVTLYGRKCYDEFFKTYINDYRKSDVVHYKKKLDPWIYGTSNQQADAPVSSRNC